ncbi:MAG: hypothetical protein JSS48_15790 [Nitrospira sp.]|nr:hypothetical protein [Nitrospira sp.]
MSGLKPKHPGGEILRPRDPVCLVTQDMPAVCLRLHGHRQRIALPYALLLRIELAEDETACDITFATHVVNVRGQHLGLIYLSVSQARAAQVGVGDSASLTEGESYLGPLVTGMRIEPTDEAGRVRR